jgi:hypothetical protein
LPEPPIDCGSARAHEKMRQKGRSRAWGESKITRREIYPAECRQDLRNWAIFEQTGAEKWLYFLLEASARAGIVFETFEEQFRLILLPSWPDAYASRRTTRTMPQDRSSLCTTRTDKSARHQQNTSLRLLILPKVLKPFWRQLRVSNGVLNVFVPEIMLERPRVLTVIGKFETATMPQ